MAKVVSQETVDAEFAKRPYRNHAKYPWDEWLDGQARVLSMREDFPDYAALRSARAHAVGAARQRGLKARSVKVSADEFIFQVLLAAGDD